MTNRTADAAGRLDLATRGVLFGVIFEKPASGLTATYRGGVVRVGSTGDGTTPGGTTPGQTVQEFAIAGSTKLFTASKDTYVSVNKSGTLVYTEVANAAAKPTLASIGTDSEFLYKVVTNGTDITSVVRLWQQASHGAFRTIDFHASFQASEKGVGAIRKYLPTGGIIRALYASLDIAAANTDAGTITPNLIHDGVTTAITGGVLTVPLSSAIAFTVEAFPTAANVAQPGDYLSVDTAKTTAGGRALCQVLIEEFPVSK